MSDIERDPERPTILSTDEERHRMPYIASRFEHVSPLSPKQISAYALETFEK
jgi:hypothetical protein